MGPLTAGTPAPAQMPALRMDRRTASDESDPLWVTSSVGTLLGVTMIGTNTLVTASWGWLADNIQGSLSTNRAARLSAEGGPSADEDDAEGEALFSERNRLLTEPAPPGGRALLRVEESVRFDPRLRSGDPATNPEAARVEGTGSRTATAAFSFEAAARDASLQESSQRPAEPAPPHYPEARRRMDELSTANPAADGAMPWVTPNSSEISRERLDAAAMAPAGYTSPDWRGSSAAPAADERPLLSGAAENYGRRGDIFSSSFRTSSTEFPGPAAAPSGPLPSGVSGLSSPTTPGAMTPPIERPRLQGLSGFDVMKPFDPAGRALTDPRGR
jgi:hypothetical protein